MLARRLASAAVIVSVLLGCVATDYFLGTAAFAARSGLILCPLAILVAMLFADEMVSLFRQHCPQLTSWPNMVICALAVAICSVPALWKDYPPDCSIGLLGWTLIALTFAVGMSLLIQIVQYSEDRHSTALCAYSILIHVQAVLLFGTMIAHRLLFFDNQLGLIALLTLITTVKMSDAAAYFTGKSFGQRKLAPALSPGKTVEGLLGSFVGALLGVALIVYLVTPYVFQSDLKVHWVWALGYSIAVTIAGVVGDLGESLFKRDAKIKDSSSWLPGLGGILDITDSIVYAAPISYFLWVLTK